MTVGLGVGEKPEGLVRIAGYAGFILIGWNAVLVPSLIRSIERDFHQSDAGFAVLYLLQAIIYATGGFGGGLLTERAGRKTILVCGALVAAAGMSAATAAGSWPLFILAMLPVSWGSAALDSGVNALFLDTFRAARGGALNLLHGFFSTGALFCPFVTGALVGHGVPWRILLLFTAIGYLSLAPLLTLTAMPSGRRAQEAVTPRRQETGETERSLLPFFGLALAIGLYVAAEMGVSSWTVRFLSDAPLVTATGILSLFWAGLTLGRLGSHWAAERVDYFLFTWGSLALASCALAAAVLLPSLPLKAVAFTLAGLFYGPGYPMIVALGGNIYPHRLAALSGSLTASAVAGSVIYPPLMGVLASRIGLGGGLLGAALLGIPATGGIILAQRISKRSRGEPEIASVG
ncbi:MAG: MFS transporter [Chloroflexota bacterium]